MKSIMGLVVAVLVLTTTSVAAELPEAPSTVMTGHSHLMVRAAMPVTAPKPLETRVIDTKFVSLALISTGSTFADSYTTLFARQNWLAGKQGVCNAEVQSAYLYGTHPTVSRVYAVAAAKSITSVAAAYYLRKHGHSKLWSLPLIANSTISLQGVTQNMMSCN